MRLHKFLRKALKSLPALKPYKTEGPRIIDGISRHTDLRHAIVHGVLADFDAPSFSNRIVKIDVDIPAGVQVAKERWFGLADMAKAGKDIGQLSIDAILLWQRLLQEIIP